MLLLTNAIDAEQNSAALAEFDRYCKQHPRSPSAEHRPRVMIRGRHYVALLGATLEEAIAGIGSNVADALRAFDGEYAAATRKAGE